MAGQIERGLIIYESLYFVMTWCGALPQASMKRRPCRRRIGELCCLLAGASAYGKEMGSGGAC